MTDVSEQMYGVICKYCINCQAKKCLADVPWYCCSINCRFFAEEKAIAPKKRQPSIKRIMKRTLVETF